VNHTLILKSFDFLTNRLADKKPIFAFKAEDAQRKGEELHVEDDEGHYYTIEPHKEYREAGCFSVSAQPEESVMLALSILLTELSPYLEYVCLDLENNGYFSGFLASFLHEDEEDAKNRWYEPATVLEGTIQLNKGQELTMSWALESGESWFRSEIDWILSLVGAQVKALNEILA
jgi:hypothetical protein